MIPEMVFGMTHTGLVILFVYSSIYSKVEDHETKNNTPTLTANTNKRNDSSLDFIFISLPSRTAEKNWVS